MYNLWIKALYKCAGRLTKSWSKCKHCSPFVRAVHPVCCSADNTSSARCSTPSTWGFCWVEDWALAVYCAVEEVGFGGLTSSKPWHNVILSLSGHAQWDMCSWWGKKTIHLTCCWWLQRKWYWSMEALCSRFGGWILAQYWGTIVDSFFKILIVLIKHHQIPIIQILR